MKKITLFVANLLACGSVMAGDVLLVNADSESANMTVSYKICEGLPAPMVCGSTQTAKLTGKFFRDTGVFTRISVPEHRLLVVTSVESTLLHSSKIMKSTFVESISQCYGVTTGDTIVLNSQGTDTFICDNRGVVGSLS